MTMQTQQKQNVKPATKEQLLVAHAHHIFMLIVKADLAATKAEQHADKREANIAISYLADLQTLLKTITALNDAALAMHSN